MASFEWIDTQAQLESLIEHLCRSDAYALDTEFHRERTYRPQLAVVQIATAERLCLVDGLAVDLSGLRRALETDAVCVIHASSQDLEILAQACETVPTRLFDPQIAALFCGYGTSSLAKLANDFLGVRLDKSSQLTDWNRRPLPKRDQVYAAADVAHLLALREALIMRLRESGRLAWAEEEMERARGRDRSPPDPDTLWWKLRGKLKLGGQARSVAQEVAKWREEVAAKENRPPRVILSDMALLAMAQRPPTSEAQLQGIRNFDARRFRYTHDLLNAVKRGVDLPSTRLVLPPKAPKGSGRMEGVISLCLTWLSQRSFDLQIDSSVLGTREDVSALLLGQGSRLSKGWRFELVGKQLRSLAEGRCALAVEGTELRLVNRRE